MSYLINFTKTGSMLHKHKSFEVIVYLSGNGLFCTQDKSTPVCAENIIIIPPDTLHRTQIDAPSERIYINGEFNGLFNLTSPIIISDNAQQEATALAGMIYANRYQNPDYTAALCNALAHFLLQNINTDDNISLAVKEIIYEITNNFHDCGIDLTRILRKSGYAEDYIRAYFKKVTGKTPTQFLTEVRIHHACSLIDIYAKALSLSQIAEKCGYTDYVYFSRRFKQLTGISPQKYRTQYLL